MTQAERTRTIKYVLAESSRWLLHRRGDTKIMAKGNYELLDVGSLDPWFSCSSLKHDSFFYVTLDNTTAAVISVACRIWGLDRPVYILGHYGHRRRAKAGVSPPRRIPPRILIRVYTTTVSTAVLPAWKTPKPYLSPPH